MFYKRDVVCWLFMHAIPGLMHGIKLTPAHVLKRMTITPFIGAPLSLVISGLPIHNLHVLTSSTMHLRPRCLPIDKRNEHCRNLGKQPPGKWRQWCWSNSWNYVALVHVIMQKRNSYNFVSRLYHGLLSKSFEELNFHGMGRIHKNRENYAPYKFGAIW